MGMSRQCLWQNNRVTLQSQTVFYNKKKVQILKTKVIRKPIKFCYILAACKAAPTILSGQGFYQLLWDALDRSNCSIKRANKASATHPPPNQEGQRILIYAQDIIIYAQGIIIYTHIA
jgi:hypothetical protein